MAMDENYEKKSVAKVTFFFYFYLLLLRVIGGYILALRVSR